MPGGRIVGHFVGSGLRTPVYWFDGELSADGEPVPLDRLQAWDRSGHFEWVGSVRDLISETPSVQDVGGLTSLNRADGAARRLVSTGLARHFTEVAGRGGLVPAYLAEQGRRYPFTTRAVRLGLSGLAAGSLAFAVMVFDFETGGTCSHISRKMWLPLLVSTALCPAAVGLAIRGATAREGAVALLGVLAGLAAALPALAFYCYLF